MDRCESLTNDISICQLPEHCLIEIFQNLDIISQFETRKVCPLFESIIDQIWKKTKRIEIDKNFVNEFVIKMPQNFKNYLSIISDHVNEFQITFWNSIVTSFVANLNFSNVHSLDLFDLGKQKQWPLQSFTKLKKLRIFIPTIWAVNLTLFQYLTHLKLGSLGERENFEYIRKQLSPYDHKFDVNCICSCEHLEELHIYSTMDIFLIVDELMRMPNLRLIMCYSSVENIRSLAVMVTILRTHIHTFAGNVDLSLLQKLHNLKYLKLANLPNIAWDCASTHDLEWENRLLKLIKCNKQLEFLHIIVTDISEGFFRNLNAVLQNTRIANQPLQFRCTVSDINGKNAFTHMVSGVYYINI